jgi:hypothetical protein
MRPMSFSAEAWVGSGIAVAHPLQSFAFAGHCLYVNVARTCTRSGKAAFDIGLPEVIALRSAWQTASRKGNVYEGSAGV